MKNNNYLEDIKLRLQTPLEQVLWAVRWVVILGVFANLLGGVAMILLAISDCYHALFESNCSAPPI